MDWRFTTSDKIILSVGLLIIAGMISGYRVTFNYSSSIPKGLYFIQKAEPKKGDYTLITKGSLLDYAIKRGYLADGSYLGKKIVAGPGDTVVVSSSGVYINSKLQSFSRPKNIDRNKRLMPKNNGLNILKKDEVFLLGETTNSFDSRYYGTIKTTYIKGTLVPIIKF